ncbi:MAG: hypothetical protein CBC84_001890 [Pelagibacteraceae bacterium TMED124]|nr:MAG: hypothetical protein CBC84_001890 [Pelagibacteraceae bacterium TMED124]
MENFKIYLFGTSSPSGLFFNSLADEQEINLTSLTRSNLDYLVKDSKYINFDKELSFNSIESGLPKIFVSFSPIWKFEKFILNLSISRPKLLEEVKYIICCSSSSSLTKRYAFSNFDKFLSNKLIFSEKSLMDISKNFGIKLKIIAPTLVYGNKLPFLDKNFNKITLILRCSPLILLPHNTGIRQPIHAKELALVFIYFLKNFINASNKKQQMIEEKVKIYIGGDHELTYYEMVKKIQDSLRMYDFGKFCVLLKIPKRLFFLIFSPLILFSPKSYESVLRLSSNLSGFTKVSELIGMKSLKFPYKTSD